MYVPLQVNRFKKIILLIVQYKCLKSCSRRFYCPNLILRTRLCGTIFITQPSCLFDFRLTESVSWKWFVLAVYQFWKGISAGPALKYFTWFIGAGGPNVGLLEPLVIPNVGHQISDLMIPNVGQEARVIYKSDAYVGYHKSPTSDVGLLWYPT